MGRHATCECGDCRKCRKRISRYNRLRFARAGKERREEKISALVRLQAGPWISSGRYLDYDHWPDRERFIELDKLISKQDRNERRRMKTFEFRHTVTVHVKCAECAAPTRQTFRQIVGEVRTKPATPVYCDKHAAKNTRSNAVLAIAGV